MKKIRVKFADFYGMKPEDTFIFRILSRHYDVELADRDPDYLIDGGLGHDYLKYDCIKIAFVGESYVPDFNHFDYAMGFDFLEFGDRYLRLPLFATYGEFGYLAELRAKPPSPEQLLKRGFCSFVVSNEDGDPARVEFFKRLSKYKTVASGGKLYNNVGGRVPNKDEFLRQYKFNIAFENSRVPGYTTEKVMQPLAVHSVPIYYGNPRIAEDFDPACMVHVPSREDMDRAIEEIIALDCDDDAYLMKALAHTSVHDCAWYLDQAERFLCNIFDQPPAAARRLNDFGYQTNLRRHARRANDRLERTSWTGLVSWVKDGFR